MGCGLADERDAIVNGGSSSKEPTHSPPPPVMTGALFGLSVNIIIFAVVVNRLLLDLLLAGVFPHRYCSPKSSLRNYRAFE